MSPTQQPVPQDSPESETCHTSWGGSVRKPLPNEAQVRLPDVAPWAWRSYGRHLITSLFIVSWHGTRGTPQPRFPSMFRLHGAPLFHWLLFFSLFADFSFPLISKCQRAPGLSPQPSVCIHSSVITSRLMALNTTQALTTHTFYLQPKLLLGTLASFTQQPG